MYCSPSQIPEHVTRMLSTSLLEEARLTLHLPSLRWHMCSLSQLITKDVDMPFACVNACIVLQDLLDSEVNSLRAVHAELDQRFADLQQQHQSDGAAAATRQATLQSELQGLTEVHVSVLNQLSEATAEVNELGDLAQEHAQLTADLVNLQAAHERLQASKEEVDAEHAELQTRAASVTQSLVDSRSAHAELSFTLTTLQAGLDSTSQHLADSEAANAELSCKVTTLQSEAETSLAQLEDQLAGVSQQHSDAQQSYQQLHDQLLQAKAECDELAETRQVSNLQESPQAHAC